MYTEFRIYRPGVAEPEFSNASFKSDEPTYPEIKALISPLLDGGDLEHVSVLFEGKRADMFVDECGAFTFRGRPPLPINKVATEIYHAASKARGRSTVDAPMIHGVAVLFSRRVWF